MLFYTHGIHATSVDSIVEAAGVTKPTLYSHFGSKENLLTAALQLRHESRQAELEEVLGDKNIPALERLLGVFDWLEAWLNYDGFRGCALVNAAVEIADRLQPGHDIIKANKEWTRTLLIDLAKEAGLSRPEELGQGLMLLIEGAVTTALTEGDRSAANQARITGKALISLHQT